LESPIDKHFHTCFAFKTYFLCSWAFLHQQHEKDGLETDLSFGSQAIDAVNFKYTTGPKE
jgi:hypothetical protein